MAKRVGKDIPQVVRFRVLSDEHVRAAQLAAWREKPDVSTYFRWLIEREWARYEKRSQRSNVAA